MFSVSIACSMQEKMPIDWKSADGSVLAMSTVILARASGYIPARSLAEVL